MTVSKEIVRARLYLLCLLGDLAGLFLSFLLANWLVLGALLVRPPFNGDRPSFSGRTAILMLGLTVLDLYEHAGNGGEARSVLRVRHAIGLEVWCQSACQRENLGMRPAGCYHRQ